MHQKLKAFLRRFPLLVHLRQTIWRWSLPQDPRIRCLADGDFHRRRFMGQKNIGSLAFDVALVVGSYRETSYLLQIHTRNVIESYVYFDGVWEKHIADLIAGYLNEEGGCVIDIGANVGASSIPLAKAFPKSTFYLFEPHPIIFGTLMGNIAYNRLENVIAKNIAITDSDKSVLPFYAQKAADNFGLSSFTLNHDISDFDVVDVQCAHLDSLFLDRDDRIKVIKVDTQGHELSVLRSARGTIMRDRPAVIFEFESEYFTGTEAEREQRMAVCDLFAGLNYSLYMIDKSGFLPRVTLHDYFHGEIIAVPNSGWADGVNRTENSTPWELKN